MNPKDLLLLAGMITGGSGSGGGGSGTPGTTFTPYVSEDGDISWTNDGGKTNPPTRNIMGPPGETPKMDAVPTQGSENAVQSGGTYTAIKNHYVEAGRKSGTIRGGQSTAEGGSTTASGYGAHAEGMNTAASGISSHAEGGNTTASNESSHAEGDGTTASGEYSHSEGSDTTASGYSSHAEGEGTTAARKSQHTFGEYNITETGRATVRGTYVEIVGNGTSPTERSNARTLDWSGNETLAGKLTMNTPGTGTNDAVTHGQMDAALSGKQDALTFDAAPAAGSANPVTSGGLRNYIGGLTSLETSVKSNIVSAINELVRAVNSLVPTGLVIYYAGLTAPNGFLACDGTIYNIIDYPALASFFETNYGSKNVWGGDGTSTFAVPDWRGEFFRAAGINSRSGCGSGANVGVHQSGTVFPTIHGANPYSGMSEGQITEYDSIAPVDHWTFWSLYGYNDRQDAYYGAVVSSRPTNTSLLVCIKT